MFRPVLVLFACAALALPAFAQRNGIPSRHHATELTVRVAYPNDRPVEAQVRVQLLNAGGVPVADTFTDSTGTAYFSRVEPGTYQLRLGGPAVQETTAIPGRFNRANILRELVFRFPFSVLRFPFHVSQ